MFRLDAAAANRLPERDRNLVFEIGAAHGGRLCLRGSRRRRCWRGCRENLRLAARRHRQLVRNRSYRSRSAPRGWRAPSSGSCARSRKAAEAACAESRAAAACVGLGRCRIDVVRVEAELIVNLALLGIAENVVGFRDNLELLLGRFVSGIHVGMVFARELAECLANLVRRGALLYPESPVIILLIRRGGHWLLDPVSALYGAAESRAPSKTYPAGFRHPAPSTLVDASVHRLLALLLIWQQIAIRRAVSPSSSTAMPVYPLDVGLSKYHRPTPGSNFK